MQIIFNGAELRLARLFKGSSLEEVANCVGKTRQYLHKLETGQATPTAELTLKLAEALDVNPSFFEQLSLPTVEEGQFHFRKLLTTKVAAKQATLARGELTLRLVLFLEKELKLPTIRIPEVESCETVDDIERAAELCRAEWGLGNGPIEHMSRLAENVGAIVTSFPGLSKEVDAMSVSTRRPIIVRNDVKESACRQRFDIAHELGHFVMHEGLITGDRTTESQANRFAGALLVPRTMMMKLFPRGRGSRLDWTALSNFKMQWKISKAASLYRARQLDLISEAQYKTGAITLRRTGEALREFEDVHIPLEQPELLERSFSVLAVKKSIFHEDIADQLQVSSEFLTDLVGFTGPKRPHLRLVS
ncbi:ImmA/IrrE family metallo-endopeptidase [Alcaligenes faecalis subsp. faecalis]|uniref:helix-turn-helix domain-containing protein n=1 Tax=Alcaligenes faecalis TaxID=511 RepID=UPI001F3D8687|nr:XRE family transcriptional regulator [Alcaligenes faecalis]MBW4789154.1 ImmA/IrrE family metallo-endopeptidase [Alcaligenes faecalis subsp. faecalis]